MPRSLVTIETRDGPWPAVPFFMDGRGIRPALFEMAERLAVVETYPGAHHGWVPRDSAVHSPDAAEQHWETLLDLFDGTLKGSSRS